MSSRDPHAMTAEELIEEFSALERLIQLSELRSDFPHICDGVTPEDSVLIENPSALKVHLDLVKAELRRRLSTGVLSRSFNRSVFSGPRC